MTAMTSKPGSARSRWLMAGAAAMLAGAVALGGGFGGATAEEKPTTPEAAKVFTPEQRAGIEAVVREYLLANPELFLEVQSELEKKLEEIQSAKMKEAVKSNAAELFKRADAPAAGAEKGDITVVEFFDYNCGFCKRGLDDIAKLIENDDKVRVVFKELPILSQGSEEAAKVALAAKQQGKYWEVHSALLGHRGSVNGETALKIAGKLGLDTAKLKADMETPAVKGEIEKVRDLAQKMGINGTPHFLVGDRAIPGAPDNLYEQLAGHIKDLRANGCEVC